jgi:hypothetical protein
LDVISRAVRVGAASLLLLAAGCGTTSPTDIPDVRGEWVGSAQFGHFGAVTFELRLSQSGGQISGVECSGDTEAPAFATGSAIGAYPSLTMTDSSMGTLQGRFDSSGTLLDMRGDTFTVQLIRTPAGYRLRCLPPPLAP